MAFSVEHVAHLARLLLTAEEIKTFPRQLDGILDYVRKLEELDTAGVEPTAHVIAVRNVMREDVVRPSLPPNEALVNAPDRAEGLYRVPKIIE